MPRSKETLKDYTSISVAVSKRQRQEINDYCDKHMLNRSELFRVAVAKYINEHSK